MKRIALLMLCLTLALTGLALNGATQPIASAAPRLQATATPGGGISVDPVKPTPQPTIPTAGGGSSGGTINGTPVPTSPTLRAPKTLDELRATYPDLGPFIDKYKDAKVGDIPMADLYVRIVEIFDQDGAAGVATFLEESGLLDKLGIPLSYLDLLREFDKGGLEAVQKMAETRQIINGKNELVGYLAIDPIESEKAETERLTALGVSVYRFLEDSEELEIGIPLDVLAQLQTPGKLLEYLTQIASSPSVVGFRAPTPLTTSGLTLQGARGISAQTIGADKWHAAGITGKGVKVGILDSGFGTVMDMLGSELPESVESNIPLEEMNEQDIRHGAAVAAVVHIIAPEAELYLAHFDFSSSDSLFDALKWLQDQGVQVINFSVGGSVGPKDGTFGLALLVDAYVRDTGVLWVNAAGNEALSHSLVKFNAGEKGLHNFASEGEAVYTMPFIAGSSVTAVNVNWNGNWKGGEKNQYDFFVLDEEGNEVLVGNEAKRGKKNDLPFQLNAFESEPGTIYYLVIRRSKGKTDHILDINIGKALLAPWAQVPQFSLSSPADADSAFAVGATGLTEDTLEEYSSQGPTGDDRIKPDITAPTGELVAGYEKGFFGTSGAAPVIAGAAALVLQAFPDLSTAEVRGWLTEHIADLGDDGTDNQFGAGRVALPDPSGEGGETEGEETDEPELIAISDVKVKYNVKVGRDRGLQIKTTFELDGYSGKELAVIAIVVDADGNAVPSANEKYDFNGTIGTGQIVKPKRNQTVFKNITLFIANSAFADVEQDEVYLIVGAIDVVSKDTANLIARSEPIALKVSGK